MSNMEDPAGDTGGESSAPAAVEPVTLPERVRVHALARLIGKTSRQVLDALSRIGEPARSAQSSVARDVALRVVEEHSVEEHGPQEGPAATVGEDAPAAAEQAGQQAAEPEPAGPARPAIFTPVFTAPSPTFLPPKQQEAPAEEEPAEEDDEPDDDTAQQDDEDGADGSRRRRRRGRRGRGRGKGGQGEDGEDEAEQSGRDTAQGGKPESGKQEQKQDAAKQDSKPGGKNKQDKNKDAGKDADEDSAGDAASDDEDGGDAGSRRRRRRRRRKAGGDEDGAESNDPPGTVTHVRDARKESDSGVDQVRSVRGSTRLEAKRQRRRDGRDAGRRRVPILSESEFLARRESVDRKMVVREHGDQVQIGVLEDDVLVEHFVTSAGSGSLVGNVYLGRVQNVLPSMEAAFVDIGRGRNAVLYAGEVDWDSAGLEGKARRIEQALSTGDSVLVQVTKDPVGHKGARLTTQISLPGRFLVYVPGGGATGISRKLPDNERKRLKDVLKKVVPGDAGVIVRTASEGVSEDELGRDVSRLQSQWEVIRDKSQQRSAKSPQLLYEEPDLLVKVVRDMFTEDFSALTVSGDNAWSTINSYVQQVAPDLAARVKLHTARTDVFTEFRIDEQIAKAMDRKVWLPSGGYLIIDRTEAMTVIDVNTGKFTGSGGNLEETVTRNNLESAEEVVRQLRLRDIGGIIVIDFIDMVLESNRDLVLRRLTECLGRDRTRHQVAEVTSLGLVQMTRKRVGTGLLEAFSTPCEHCRGRGVVVSTEPVHSGGGNGGNNGGSGNGGGNNNGGGNGSRKKRGRGGDEHKQANAQQAQQNEPEHRHDSENRKAVAAVAAATMSGERQAEPKPAADAAAADAPVADPQPADVQRAEVQHADAAPPDVAPSEPTPSGTTPSETPSEAAPPETPAAGQSSNGAAPENGADAGDAAPESNGHASGATVPTGTRRRRRTASRPAGPPESTPV